MTRAVVFILMLIPMALYNAIKPEDLNVTVTVPQELKKGASGEITYSFTRGDIKGFGRLQETFPSGVEIEAIETSGATFTFDNDIMKVIWLNLPKNKEFEVKLKLTATEDIKAEEIKVGGKLSYLVDNQRQTYTVVDEIIKVIHPEIIAAKEAEEKEANKVEVYSANRVFEPLGDDKYKVTLQISKSAFGGFGKIEEFVPLGATAEAIETKKAVFSFIKDKAKFVWMAIPTDELLEVSYNLDLSGATSKETGEVKGTFSYLDNKETKTTDILTVEEQDLLAAQTEQEETTSSDDEGQQESTSTEQTQNDQTESQESEDNNSSTTQEESTNSEDKTEAESTTEENKDEAVTAPVVAEEEEMASNESESNEDNSSDESTQQSQDDNTTEEASASATEEEPSTTQEEPANENLTAGTTQNMNPDQGVSYRVQIAAGQNVVDKPYFKKRHNFTEDFFIDNHEGWVKYTTGTFGVYKSARDKREVINDGGHKFDGPFVTAYNNGERITVQEALMITKQQWFK